VTNLDIEPAFEVEAPEIGAPEALQVIEFPDKDIFSQEYADDPYRVLNVTPIDNPGAKLLYRAATGLEKALADTDAERLLRMAAEIIKVQWNPWQISEHNLPFLAWAMGVNLWEPYWQVEFRRWWVANQWWLKSIRGTKQGLIEFIKAVRGEVKRVIVPPALPFGLPKVGDIPAAIDWLVPDAQYTAPAGVETREKYEDPEFFQWLDDRPKPEWDDLVRADRAIYVARFPQLRIYPYEPRIQLPWLCYPGHKFELDGHTKKHNKNGFFLGPLWRMYPTNYNQGGKYTRFARMYEPMTGVETDLTFRTITSVDLSPYGVRTWDQITLPGHKSSIYHEAEPGKYLRPFPNAKRGVFLGRLHSTSARMVIVPRDGSLNFKLAKAQYQTIFPDNDVLNVYPEHVAIRHQRRDYTEAFSGGGDCLHGKFLPKSLAYRYMYERWYLFDPARVPDVRIKSVYMGNCRFGIHKYTAEAHVKIQSKLPPFIVKTSGYLWGFMRPRNLEAVNRLRRGTRASMALRDKVLLYTKSTRTVQVRDLLDASGRYSVGEVIPN